MVLVEEEVEVVLVVVVVVVVYVYEMTDVTGLEHIVKCRVQ